MIKEKKILADSWYTEHLEGNIITVKEYFAQNYNFLLVKLSQRFKIVRGLLLFKASKNFDLIVTTLGGRGVTLFIIIEAICTKKRNRIVLLEFFRPTPILKLYQAIWPFWSKYIFGPSLRFTLAKAQVLTLKEIETYSKLFGVPKERFSFIPWPLHFDHKKKQIPAQINADSLNRVEMSNYVMASGRANVDWETIFEVAETSDWPFLAVCSSQHLERVNRLNKNKKAIVLHDISQEEHGKYVRGATVYALCIIETNTSVGHIRLMNTIEQGVPVVATQTSGLDGYASNGVNAILVPPGDVNALKKAIDSLMYDQALRDKLVKSARSFQPDRTFTNYIESIKKCISEITLTEMPSDINMPLVT